MATILVVDDSNADRRVVGNMLSEVGKYDVKFAENGEEALIEMRRSVPDLVVTDLFMPVLDGLKLVARTRREFPLVPVVLITSKGSEELAVEALQCGAASYVPKRLLSRYLIETVKTTVHPVGFASTLQHEGEPMADQELLAEVQRELAAIRVEAERLAGRVRALETVVDRFGQDAESIKSV